MTIQQMRYYITVCKLQNISQAARELHIAQSTLSQSMQTLEKEIGINLFNHTGKNIFITQEGKKLFHKVNQLLQYVDRFEDEVKDLARNRNHIKAAVPPQLATQLIPAILGDFHTQHPEIRLELIEPSGAGAAELVANEEVDFAVINMDEEKHPGLTYRPISTKSICLALWPGHPWENKKSVTFEEVAQLQLVLLGQEFFITRKMLREFRERNLNPEILYFSDNLSTLVSLLHNHTAVAILSTQALSSQGNLRLIPFAEPQILTTCLVTKKGRQIYYNQRLLMDFLKNL